MEILPEKLKNFYDRLNNIDRLMKIYVNVVSNDDQIEKVLLSLLNSIDKKIEELKKEIAQSIQKQEEPETAEK